MALEQALRAAAGSLRVPGGRGVAEPVRVPAGAAEANAEPATEPAQPEADAWQVIGPAQVEVIAAEHGLARWQVEIAALEAEIVPLHYMRNLARFGIDGQVTLLRSAVTVVGSGVPIQKCLQILAAHGIGRLRVLVPSEALGARRQTPAGLPTGPEPPASAPELAPGAWRLASPASLAAAATNQNASLHTSADTLDLRRGDPAAQLDEPEYPADGWVVVGCLEDAAEEMLLQAACRRRRVPLVLGALQESLGQATTILPGDPGVALIYQGDHLHLDRLRPGSLRREGYQGRIIGAWLADQVIALRLGLGELLQNRLLYADMETGAIHTFKLGR